jgi:hypothetical protein
VREGWEKEERRVGMRGYKSMGGTILTCKKDATVNFRKNYKAELLLWYGRREGWEKGERRVRGGWEKGERRVREGWEKGERRVREGWEKGVRVQEGYNTNPNMQERCHRELQDKLQGRAPTMVWWEEKEKRRREGWESERRREKGERRVIEGWGSTVQEGY